MWTARLSRRSSGPRIGLSNYLNRSLNFKTAKAAAMVRRNNMVKRIFAIAFIFVCTSVAWIILGGTIFSRTYDSDQVSANRVASTWGTPQNQAPPKASFHQVNIKNE